MKTLLILLPFLALAKPLLATVYKGTIGKYPVYLELSVTDYSGETELYGVYFYEKACVDIGFEGRIVGNKYLLSAGTLMYTEEDAEHFTLVKVGKALTGTWEQKGKKLDVVLRECTATEIPNKYMENQQFRERNLSELEHIRTSLAEFEKTDSITRLDNGIALTWYKEKHWESYLFRVTKGLPATVMANVNNFLEAEQLSGFSGYGSCGTGEFTTDVQNLFVNTDFLAYEESVGYFCGGAHPDYSTFQVNYSLKENRTLKTDELLLFPGVVVPTPDNFDDWSAYRRDVFATRILEYLKISYPEEFLHTDPSEEEETEEEYYEEEFICDYSDPAVWEFSDVLITPDGLKVSCYFSRYMRHCDDPGWSFIAYDLVREYLNPAYKEALMKLAK